MQNFLSKIIFPVGYPLSIIWHIILGAGLGCIPPQFIYGAGDTHAAVKGAVIGAILAPIIGVIIWLLTKKKWG